MDVCECTSDIYVYIILCDCARNC